jgi:hypothetical protein
MNTLSPLQQSVVTAGGSSVLTGPAGTGKSTTLRHRLLHLLQSGEPAYTILILVEDRSEIDPTLSFLQAAQVGAYADLNVIHYNNLAREMVTLFWPLVARTAGFSGGHRPPTFLGYDLSQLLMWRIVTPMLGEGSFSTLRLRPQQIVSQLLDTLNRAALNNLDVMTATERQISSWTGEPDHVRNLRHAMDAASAFRAQCQENNLLDLSLTIDTFNRHVLAHPEFFRYFSERYQHLLVDNVEEQTPAGQQFIAKLMGRTVSTTIAYDEGGGYKRFLAADPDGSRQFQGRASRVFRFTDSFTTTDALRQVGQVVDNYLQGAPPVGESTAWHEAIIGVVYGRYRREMVFQLAERVAALIEEDGVPAYEIAIIAPYLDGALRYSLLQAFKRYGVPTNVLRRRASPREEPRVRTWLTWLALAQPTWGIEPAAFDVAEALALSIGGLDPARAALLTEGLYQPFPPLLRPISDLPTHIADRIDPALLALVEELRLWLADAGDRYRLDEFIYHLFADLLATRRFQPEPDVAGAAVCDWLVRSAEYLVQSAAALGLHDAASIGNAFVSSINQGLVTSEPPDTGDPPDPNGVSISTIYGYLLRGKPVRVQVWLETAASGWWDIPRQPLSNAFVLSQSWDAERAWTMQEEIDIRNQLLTRVAQGLINRCHDGVILATSDLDRRGQRQDGPLWKALQGVVRPVT